MTPWPSWLDARNSVMYSNQSVLSGYSQATVGGEDPRRSSYVDVGPGSGARPSYQQAGMPALTLGLSPGMARQPGSGGGARWSVCHKLIAPHVYVAAAPYEPRWEQQS
jgi:hypothetical protein